MEKKFLLFDKASYDRTLSSLPKIANVIDMISEQFESFGIGPFTQEVYDIIINQGIGPIKNRYQQAVEKDLSKFKTSALRNGALWDCSVQLNKLSELNRMLDETVQRAQSTITGPISIDLSYFQIIDGRAQVTDESKATIRERFTVYIETETEQKTYDLLMRLKEAWDTFRDHIKKHGTPGYNYDIYDPYGYGFVNENSEGYMELNEVSVKWLNQDPISAAHA